MPRLTPGDFYTTKELADVLKLTPRTVQRWVDAGQLPAYRFGRKYRVRGEDFEVFLDTYKAHQPELQPRAVTDTVTDISSQPVTDTATDTRTHAEAMAAPVPGTQPVTDTVTDTDAPQAPAKGAQRRKRLPVTY